MYDETHHFATVCGDCFREMLPCHYFLVVDDVWLLVAEPKEMLCFECFETRLGRNLTLADFHPDKMAFNDSVLNKSTPREFRYNHYVALKISRPSK